MNQDRLDVSSEPNVSSDAAPMAGEPRRHLGVTFACCGVYARVYVNREETAYVGACPRCAKQVRFTVGPGGSDARFFTAF